VINVKQKNNPRPRRLPHTHGRRHFCSTGSLGGTALFMAQIKSASPPLLSISIWEQGRERCSLAAGGVAGSLSRQGAGWRDTMWNRENHMERGTPCQQPKIPRHILA